MKNKEKYFDELLSSLVGPGGQCSFRLKNVLKEKDCNNYTCKSCDKKTKEWFEQEYIEPLNEDERAFLKVINNRTWYKWIIRKENEIVITHKKPLRDECNGIRYWELCDVDDYHVIPYLKDLFKFITDNDQEPYLIEDLLNE